MSAHLTLKSKRIAAALALILSSTGSTWAAPRAEGAAASAESAAGASQPAANAAESAKAAFAAPAPDPSSPVAVELKELKDAVDAQVKQFAEHSQQLDAERAALKDELARIAGIEAKLGIPTGSDPSGAAPTADRDPCETGVDAQFDAATPGSDSSGLVHEGRQP